MQRESLIKKLKSQISYRVWVLIGILIMSQAIKAEQTVEAKIDSLKSVVESDVHDTIRIIAYVHWDNMIYRSDPKLDLEINFKIAEICSENSEKEVNPKEALFFKKYQAKAFNNLGIIFKNKGDYESARNYQMKGLAIKKELGDEKGIANSFLNLGTIYHTQGNLVKALDEYFE